MKNEIRSYRDLIVWQKAMEVVEDVYKISSAFPKVEEYRIVSQLNRAVVSIPANIAEGHSRGSRREYSHFISIAYGSLAEVETLLILSLLQNSLKGQSCMSGRVPDRDDFM